MEANAARLRMEVERFGVAVSEATKRDPLPGATLAGPVDSRGVRGNRRRPATTTGVVGTGKRHQACGLVRAVTQIVASSVDCRSVDTRSVRVMS